jgi:hypothetical protein
LRITKLEHDVDREEHVKAELEDLNCGGCHTVSGVAECIGELTHGSDLPWWFDIGPVSGQM